MKELEVINMGLIRAAAGAVGGTLADSWLEYITAGDMGANTVMTMVPALRWDRTR